MDDEILQHQPDWRYCRVRAGEKKPYPAGWQNSPLTLDQVDSSNIGLLLGPAGNGICAIDFDGTTAWSWLAEQGIDYRDLHLTPTWASGKEDRCQMAFRVPEKFWEYISTKKIITRAPTGVGTGDGEGFEFRWAGGQSVLPPSIHPDTGNAYQWLISAENTTAWIPEALLLLWLDQMIKEQPKSTDDEPEVQLDDLDDFDIAEAESVLKILKERRPGLSYDEWRTVCWGLAHHIGREAAGVLIKTYYPEQKRNEYSTLFKNWNKSKSPTLGSLMFMAGLKK